MSEMETNETKPNEDVVVAKKIGKNVSSLKKQQNDEPKNNPSKQDSKSAMTELDDDVKENEFNEFIKDIDLKKEKVGKILSRMIIQIAGAPEDHINKTIRAYLDKIRDVENYKVVSQKIYNAEKDVDTEKIFVAFAEIDILFENVSDLASFCFDTLPASIEILEPQSLNFESRDFVDFMNDIMAKMHNVNKAVETVGAENRILQQNSQALLENFFILSLKQNNKNINELSKEIGISEEQIKPLLGGLEEKGLIKYNKENKDFSLIKNI